MIVKIGLALYTPESTPTTRLSSSFVVFLVGLVVGGGLCVVVWLWSFDFELKFTYFIEDVEEFLLFSSEML